MKIKAIILLMVLVCTACSESKKDLGPAPVSENYQQDIAHWIDDRVETLKEPTGWMRLAGMFVLEEGENRFGSGSEQDIQFPEESISNHAGVFILQNGNVTLNAAEGVTITHNGQPVSEMVIFDGENAPVLEHGSLEWHVIERQDLIAIRLYNKENPEVDRFDGFDRYPTDPKWHLAAEFKPNPAGSTIPISNVLGQVDDIPNPGSLTFQVENRKYTIQALEASGNRLFIIVGDETNQTETYQAGRYMYVDVPDDSGRTIIDFNKVYNPPCAYTLYSTCQLPPLQNRLDLSITAGEKRALEWEGL